MPKNLATTSTNFWMTSKRRGSVNGRSEELVERNRCFLWNCGTFTIECVLIFRARIVLLKVGIRRLRSGSQWSIPRSTSWPTRSDANSPDSRSTSQAPGRWLSECWFEEISEGSGCEYVSVNEIYVSLFHFYCSVCFRFLNQIPFLSHRDFSLLSSSPLIRGVTINHLSLRRIVQSPTRNTPCRKTFDEIRGCSFVMATRPMKNGYDITLFDAMINETLLEKCACADDRSMATASFFTKRWESQEKENSDADRMSFATISERHFSKIDVDGRTTDHT